jgi:SanA protein
MTSRIARDLILLGFAVLALTRIIFLLTAIPNTYLPDEVPSKQVAIVFGAALQWNGTPSAVLRDRIETAVKLYKAGKVKKLLMSGDNRFIEYNEPESMRQYALSLGVPDNDIVLDFAGRRTYDTCYRAKEIFGVETAILVTQGFHMPRALFLCNHFGIESAGVESDNYYYLKRSRLIWNIREILATTGAIWDIYFSKPAPVLGTPEPIFAQK